MDDPQCTNQISINKFPFAVYAAVRKGGVGGNVLMRTKADKGEWGQFLLYFCGRPVWMTPWRLSALSTYLGYIVPIDRKLYRVTTDKDHQNTGNLSKHVLLDSLEISLEVFPANELAMVLTNQTYNPTKYQYHTVLRANFKVNCTSQLSTAPFLDISASSPVSEQLSRPIFSYPV